MHPSDYAGRTGSCQQSVIQVTPLRLQDEYDVPAVTLNEQTTLSRNDDFRPLVSNATLASPTLEELAALGSLSRDQNNNHFSLISRIA